MSTTTTTEEAFFLSTHQAPAATEEEEQHSNPDVCSPHCIQDEIESILNTKSLPRKTITAFEVTSIFHSVQNLIIQFVSQAECDASSLNNNNKYEEVLMEKVFAWLSQVSSELLVIFEEQVYIAVVFVNMIRRKKANVLVNEIFNEKGLNLSFGEDVLSQHVSNTLEKLWIERNSNEKLRISNCFVEQVASILIDLIMLTNDKKALESLHPLFELFCKQVNAGFWPEQREAICRYLSYNSLNLMGHFTFYSLKKELTMEMDN